MKDRIKKFRIFNIFQYDLEEEFLREMHRQGYAFEKISGIFIYNFKRVEAEDVVYKLDYPGVFRNVTDKDDYIQMFEDDGWEYLGENFEYTYFRKKTKDGINLDIFSDEESKRTVLERIFKKRFLILLLPLALLFISGYLMDFGASENLIFSTVGTFTKVAICILLIEYLWVTWSFFRIINKLKRKDV